MPVERRLRETPLARVDIPFAREKALAEEALGPLQPGSLRVVVLVGDEDVPDEVGVLDEEDVLPPERVVDDVGRLPRHPAHEGERIALKPAQRIEKLRRRPLLRHHRNRRVSRRRIRAEVHARAIMTGDDRK